MFEYTDPIEIHDQLNPSLWQGDDLRKDVQYALLKIAKEFYQFLDIDVTLLDLVVSGRQVNYNYTKHSDLDLHLIVPYSQVECDVAVDELFDAKRKLWKQQHDISVKGVPVELYVEDVDNPPVSSSYSVVRNEWIKRPNREAVNYDEQEVRRVFAIWERAISGAIATDSLEMCRNIKDMLKMYRKEGLAQHGEFGVPNLVFKALRNDGQIGKLMDAIGNLHDRQLSL
jgi:hypothetical protein